MQNEEYMRRLSSKRITAIGYEYMQDESGIYPIIQAMSEIVGSTSILIAAEYLSNAFNGKGELLGGIAGIPPTGSSDYRSRNCGRVCSACSHWFEGATVKVFDNFIHRLRAIAEVRLGSRIYTSTPRTGNFI